MAEDESDAEALRLDHLESGKENWQRAMAERIRSDAQAQLPAARAESPVLLPSPKRRFHRFSALGLGAAVAATLAVVVWLSTHTSPEVLVQRAFKERRTIAVRIEGVPWTELQQQRGATDVDRLALIDGKAKVLPQVKRHPDDVYWLDQAARLYLIENNQQSIKQAIEMLEKARKLDPSNIDVRVDLASAYLLSADLSSQPDNIGLAVQLLLELKNDGKGGETVQWNYAIAEERFGKWDRALQAWQEFVHRYPNSAWTHEAEHNLVLDQKRVSERQAQTMLGLRSAEQISADYEDQDKEKLRGIDNRIEEYQEAVVQDWLPAEFSSHSSKRQAALKDLARTLSASHNDTWLAEMLAQRKNQPAVKLAVQLLARSARNVETAEVHAAERDATVAETLFHAVGSEAGAARARLTIILALQYEHHDDKCRKEAMRLLSQSAIGRYSWIKGQALLEAVNCSPSADSTTLDALETAKRISQEGRFPVLQARTLCAQSALSASLGDFSVAWQRSSEALNLYWRGAVPPLRGYNALITLYELNRFNTHWALQADILKDAVQLVMNDPRTMMVAVAYAQLGEALFRAGSLDESRASYDRAEFLVSSSPSGRERNALSAEIELGIAKIQLGKNLPRQAEERLQAIRGTLIQMADNPIQIDFLLANATALLRLDRLGESERDLDLAVILAQRDLRRINSGNDRWKTSRQYEELFRTSARVKLRTDPAAALAVWEMLKAESLRAEASPASLLPASEHAVFLTYMALPDGLAVWAWDGSNLRERSIAVNLNSLDSLISRFLEECSDPDSNIANIRRDATSLYSQIFAPLETWIRNRQTIVIEPDGALKKIPFALLVDARGTYLGDRLNIHVSPGMPYLNGARALDPLSPKSGVFIVANPKVPGWPPLPAATEEAHTVAALFDQPRLIEGAPLQPNEIANLAATANLFHFAGHGFVDVDRAGIVLEPSNASSAFEFSSLSEGRTSLVVLSACSTSLGTNGLYDGESSMVRTLLAAHVRNVVASRWNVDSSSTSLLMKHFYAELLRDKPVPEALSFAMRRVREVPEYQHPYYWAAFSVFGSA